MQDEYDEIKARVERTGDFTGLTQGEVEEIWPDIEVDVIYREDIYEMLSDRVEYLTYLDEDHPHHSQPHKTFADLNPVEQADCYNSFVFGIDLMNEDNFPDGYSVILVEGHNW